MHASCLCTVYIYVIYMHTHEHSPFFTVFVSTSGFLNRGDTFAITYVFWDIDQRFYKNITTFDNYRYLYDNHYLLDKNGIFKNDHYSSNRVHWTKNKIR